MAPASVSSSASACTLRVRHEAVRERRLPQSAQLVGEAPPVRVGDVDGRGWAASLGSRLDEQPSLGVEVLVHRAVEVEVILAQVREDERAEANVVQPMLRGRVRRRLHRAAAVTRVEHVPEGALEVDGLRGRVPHRPPLASDPALDGAEQARPVSGRGEHRVEQEGGRGLPVRARDRSDGECRRRPAEEGVGGGCHRCSRIPDDELRRREIEATLDDQRDGAPGERFGGMVVAVRRAPANAEVERSRRYLTAVEGEVVDRHLGRAGGRGCPDRLPKGSEVCLALVLGHLGSIGSVHSAEPRSCGRQWKSWVGWLTVAWPSVV